MHTWLSFAKTADTSIVFKNKLKKMEVVGSEIGQKMRSAIKAKLTELGCYVDDELPDYVMVMVANKRTRAQMEDDLQLFLGENTMLFVNWLHQVLKKLQEVTVTAPLKQVDHTKSKDKLLSKEKKRKEKKDKQKSKKKKRDKAKGKSHHKKDEKKGHKSKKKGKHHEMIHPNVPPLLMNIEKESEPSITDVFAGQILKNHGVNIDSPNDSLSFIDKKPTVAELKRPILPIIDPATISSQVNLANEEDQSPQQSPNEVEIIEKEQNQNTTDLISSNPQEEQVREIANSREEQIKEIETKVKNLKQKLTEQLDAMSDDEDFLNIRTEADELMNDFAEDVLQEISANVTTSKQQSPQASPPKSLNPFADLPQPASKEPMELPQIELKLPKRPVRERLGAKEETKIPSEVTEKATIIGTDSPERFTPEREPEIRVTKSAKSRLGEPPEVRKSSMSDEETCDKADTISKRLTSKISQDSRMRGCASVVRVRPRPRVAAPASSLLLRAVADAQRSLMNIPTKHEQEPQKVKRALVLPMRRTVDPQKIVIQVARGETERQSDLGHDQADYKEPKLCSDVTDSSTEWSPTQITKKIVNTDYVPPRRSETRTSTKKDDTLIVETINIHHQTVDKEKDTQFIVTMDGYHLNALLAKKLKTEGLLDEEDELEKPKPKYIEKLIKIEDKSDVTLEQDTQVKATHIHSKLLSDASEESDTQVIVNTDKHKKRKSIDISKQDGEYNKTNLEKGGDRNEKRESSDTSSEEFIETPVKKRKASPIVFSVEKEKLEKQPERVTTASASSDNQIRARTASASSDNQVTVTTNVSTTKYDTVPPLSTTGKPVVWCRAFPLCRFGSACAYSHPRCKFAAACTRRNCMYSHSPQVSTSPVVASHVVPAANYKTISAASLPSLCKFYPNCVNPACHFYHPKPCRYGKACLNKLECNFYHNDVPSTKWRHPV